MAVPAGADGFGHRLDRPGSAGNSGTGRSQLNDAAEQAAEAANMLREAVSQLDEALTEDDQVASLTRMIRAYEQGLSALREGLRRAGIREQEIRTEFDRAANGWAGCWA
ncbi:hypothetical protein ACFSS8_09955 [Paracoccus kondratievae]